VAYNTRKSFFDELLRNVSVSLLRSTIKMKIVNLRILSTVSDCSAFSLAEFALRRTNEINGDFDMFPYEPLAKVLASFLRIMSLLGIGCSV
jgi:hypothetical protein